ncbi:MAG: class I SAM-dependent methyltransferase [Ilumatobacteraceae bacterium]
MRPSAVLSSLPAPAARRLAVRATPDAIRRLKAGHPWLFEGSIRSVSHEGSPGDLAVVFDDDRQFVAIGLWDPDSPIRLKVLHQGKPAPIDEAWMRARIEAAVARRHPIAMPPPDTPPTTAYRVVHGENDGLPGLVVDRYAHVAVVKLYSAVGGPPAGGGADPARGGVGQFDRVAARPLDPAHHLHGLEEGQSLVGPEISAPVSFLEHGLRFEADVVAGQKTGHFLDQRDNRIEVGRRARGARVLDVFSCTGGFGVHAARRRSLGAERRREPTGDRHGGAAHVAQHGPSRRCCVPPRDRHRRRSVPSNGSPPCADASTSSSSTRRRSHPTQPRSPARCPPTSDSPSSRRRSWRSAGCSCRRRARRA